MWAAVRICYELLVICWNFANFAIADNLQTQFGDGRSRANDGGIGVVEFSSVGEDVVNIELDGLCAMIESTVQPRFDDGEIHRVCDNGSVRRKKVQIDCRSKMFRFFQFHHFAQFSRDSIAFRVAVQSSPIFRSGSVQCFNNLFW